jgi:hypothetical protein
MRKIKISRKKGSTIVETAASLLLYLPILVTFLFVIMEVATFFMIKETLAQGARQAARDLAVVYGSNPGIVNSRAQQNTLVFDTIRFYNIINASAQFSNPTFNPNSTPPTVTVSVSYTGNQFGLPPFPNPDPLHLGSNFVLNSTSTYRLE